MGKGILTESTYNLVKGNKSVLQSQGQNMSIASTIPDYTNFKQVNSINFIDIYYLYLIFREIN